MNTRPVMRVLFREHLNRAELLSFPLQDEASLIHIAVHRNHAFELAASAMNPFLNLSLLRAEFWHSGYDDSFFFAELPEQADIHIVWVDALRYHMENFGAWLGERCHALKAKTGGKIIAAFRGAPCLHLDLPDDAIALNVDAALAPLGEAAYAPERRELTGTGLSGQGLLWVARELGCRHVPALLRPALKAIVLDLDNTLYSGVLGEDGPQGVTPYLTLQERLKELRGHGFMLALASKNEEADVRRLFAERGDFPLRWEDFAAVAINWRAKPENILNIANELNIAPNAMLFLDDNPGETLRVKTEIPELRVIEASSPEASLNALRYCPGLMKTRLTPEDALRTRDIQAGAARKNLRSTPGSREYLQTLDMEINFALNPQEHLLRITELLNKTNQFILSFLRPDAAMVKGFLKDAGKCVITAALRDKFSDSGVIATLMASRLSGHMLVEEAAVSCRALGRGVEGGMLAHMLRLTAQQLEISTGDPGGIYLRYAYGPRNRPALDWLGSLDAKLFSDGRAYVALPPQERLPGARVTVTGSEKPRRDQKSIVIVGNSGFARECNITLRAAIQAGEPLTLRGFLSFEGYRGDLKELAPMLLGVDDEYVYSPGEYAVIGIGDPFLRKKAYAKLKARGTPLYTLVHPNSYVDYTSPLGEGCIVTSGCHINCNCAIGPGNVFNGQVHVGHDCRVGECNFFGPASQLLGGVSMGDCNQVGAGSIVMPAARIGCGNIIAPLSALYKGCRDNVYMAGNPALKIGSR